ncbi:MAG: PrsW family glutamic-type intramembrane protease, partial [Bacteroidota bacterium]
IYAAFISLGFATIENLFYVYEGGIRVAILRMFMTVPGHATWGIFMGYFIGIAKFHPTNKLPYLLAGLGVAVVAHGSYDYFLFEKAYDFLIFLSVLLIVVSIFVSRRAIRIHQERSPFKPEG